MAATLVIDIITNANKAQADMARASGGAQSFGSRVKASMKGVGTAIAGAFAAQKVVAFAQDSVKAASDLNETMSKTEQVFGRSSKAVVAWSEDSSNALGQSQADALDAASGFAIFGKSAGLTGGDLVGFSTKLTGLASDMASFSNTSPQEAAEALGAALRGEAEPIRKYGVLLDDATLKSRAMKMGLIKTTKDALTPQQKVLASYKEVMAQTKDAQGDFARTSDGLANQQRILAAKFENTKATVGQALLPVLLAAVTIFQDLAHWAGENAGWLGPLAGAILAVAAAVKVWNIVQAILNSTMLASPVFWVVLGIVALVAAIVLAYKRFKWFRDLVQAVFGAIKTVVGATVDFIKKHWGLLLGILTGPFGLAVLLIIKYRDKITGAFKAVPGLIGRALSRLWSIITAPFLSAWHFIRDNVVGPLVRIWQGIPGAIGRALSGVWRTITTPFVDAWHFIRDKVLGPLKTAFRAAFSWVKDIWNGFAGAWNAIEITLPKVHIPGTNVDIGGGTIGLPDLPRLGAGGYVNRATLAVVGERGGEIVAPEPVLRSIIRSELAAGAGTTINVNGALDPDAVARQISGILRKRAQRVGGISQRGGAGVR